MLPLPHSCFPKCQLAVSQESNSRKCEAGEDVLAICPTPFCHRKVGRAGARDKEHLGKVPTTSWASPCPLRLPICAQAVRVPALLTDREAVMKSFQEITYCQS